MTEILNFWLVMWTVRLLIVTIGLGGCAVAWVYLARIILPESARTFHAAEVPEATTPSPPPPWSPTRAEQSKTARELLDEAIALFPETDRLRDEHHRIHQERVESLRDILERWRKRFPD